MLKLHTAVIIDCPTHSSLDPKVFEKLVLFWDLYVCLSIKTVFFPLDLDD